MQKVTMSLEVTMKMENMSQEKIMQINTMNITKN